MKQYIDDSLVTQGKKRLRITAELRNLLTDLSREGDGPAFPAGNMTASQAVKLADGIRKGVENREKEADTREVGRSPEPIAGFTDPKRRGHSELIPVQHRWTVQVLLGLLDAGAVAIESVPPLAPLND